MQTIDNVSMKSIIEVNDGILLKQMDHELAKVVENINETNTDTKVRKLTIEIALTPSKDKKLLYLAGNVKSTLRPIQKTEATLFNQQYYDDSTGEVIHALQEVMDVNIGQINIDGDIKEAPKPIRIGALLED